MLERRASEYRRIGKLLGTRDRERERQRETERERDGSLSIAALASY